MEFKRHKFEWNSIQNVWMKFYILCFDKTVLFSVIEQGNIEIAKLLLMNNNLDPNTLNILNFFFFDKIFNSVHKYNFINNFFNSIKNKFFFSFDSKSFFSIQFTIIIFEWNFNEIWFYKTALYVAVEKRNIEIVKLLLESNNIDPNVLNILYFILLIKFISRFKM